MADNPFDPFASFFDPTGSRAKDFADMVEKAANGGFVFDRDASGIPRPKKCESEKELAAWFRAFARACKPKAAA